MSISDHIVVINPETPPWPTGTPEQIRDNPDAIKMLIWKRETC